MSIIRFLELAIAVSLSLAAMSAEAAVIRLRAEHRATTNIVRLGDLAQVESADADEAERLAAIELFPAPVAGRSLEVGLREIQDAMTRQNESPAYHIFAGASRVTVAAPAAGTGMKTAFLTTSHTRRATERLKDSISEYLSIQVSPGHWNVELQLTAEQAQAIRTHRGVIAVARGHDLEAGQTRFEVGLETPAGKTQFVVDAAVSRSPAVVVALRPIPRGARVQATDVEVRHAEPPRGEKATFSELEDVLGMQVMRAIRAGQVLDDRSVQPELLVRRRDVVTVIARAGGVEVRTTARARDDGSHGELIAVESLTSRKSFFARVSGPQRVEVLAQPIRPAVTTTRHADSLTIQEQGARR